ncbi:MAG: UDP-N-acetylmuramate--L-alanine ligase [Clostridia bacterium]|nr:UDP-N-acetylmuramate--L-alanine ligase [Clostridia bacterium]
MALENTHYGAEAIKQMLAPCHSIFFIGIGGISMSALAQISERLGYRVGGSDRSQNAQTEALRGQGIPIFPGHDRANIAHYDAVVYTVAIGADNPEYLAAQEAGKPLLSRADYLGYLMVAYRNRIGVSGMHGKSTCTAMCAQIFLEAADPTVLCGAELPALQNATCRIGNEKEHIVFEACEYMDSFLDFNPTLAVILNIGMDHVDYFHSMEQIRASFLHFAERTGKDGTVLFNADDAESIRTLEAFAGRKVSFAIDADADFCARRITHVGGVTQFDFCRARQVLCRVRLHVFGKHNIYNALAAASAASLCGIAPEQIAAALEGFVGARRRMERKGVLNGAAVYDDYGHHPDEIRATLAGAREMGYKRILCAYQPHTYSRTAGLFREFSEAFGDADRVYLADIYAAREQNIYGVSSELLAQGIGTRGKYCGSFQAVADALCRDAHEGDLVIVMGAGDIYQVFDLLPLA